VGMIHLLQLLTHIKDLNAFEAMFSDLDEGLEETGSKDNPEAYIYQLLESHYGLEVCDERQLRDITKTITSPEKFKAALSVTRMKRGLK